MLHARGRAAGSGGECAWRRRGNSLQRGSGWFVQARKRGNARAHGRLHPKCHRVSGQDESLHDRRRGLPTDSGRQAASPSPNHDVQRGAGGNARREWCKAPKSSTPSRPNADSPVILGQRPSAPSAVGRVRSAAFLVVLFDDAPDRPCCASLFVPLSLELR